MPRVSMPRARAATTRCRPTNPPAPVTTRRPIARVYGVPRRALPAGIRRDAACYDPPLPRRSNSLVMQLVGKLATLVSIEQRELRTATLMLAHSFAMGLTTVFFETAASALFLSHFESSALPWVYLAAAATSAVTGIVYTNLLGRVAFRRLMLGTLGFLALTTLALRAGLWLTPAGGLLFAVLVWYRVISILTDLEYWAVAARLYDVRQAKRLYPFIGSGEVAARIAGAFSVPIFLGYMGVENLLLLSAAATAACMGLLGLALRGKNVDSVPESKSKEANKWGLLEPLRAVTRTRYLRLLVSIAFFAVLGKYFVDFAFLAEMRGRFTEVKELASAFAIFSGVSQSLSLLTRFFVAGRVLNRYGVKAGLLGAADRAPRLHLLLVISGVAPGLAMLVFWFAIGNQGIYKTLKHPIDNPSFKILYQPLARDERLKTQVALETIVTPIGIAIAGAVMLQFSVLIPYDPVKFALALAMAFAGWVLLCQTRGSGLCRSPRGGPTGAHRGHRLLLRRRAQPARSRRDPRQRAPAGSALRARSAREELASIRSAGTPAPPAARPRLARRADLGAAAHREARHAVRGPVDSRSTRRRAVTRRDRSIAEGHRHDRWRRVRGARLAAPHPRRPADPDGRDDRTAPQRPGAETPGGAGRISQPQRPRFRRSCHRRGSTASPGGDARAASR